LVIDMPDLVYLNGNYLPLAEARIAVTDYGFLFGYAIYETLRAYQGRLFRMPDHLARLEKSAAILSIPCDIKELEQAALETLRRSGIAEARVRLTLTRGEGSLAPDPRTCRRPTVLITVVPYTPPAAEVYQKGYRALTSAIRRNSASQLPGMKTACFLESLLARQQARQAGVDDAVLLNEQGRIAEASSSNLFLVSRGVLKTPGLENGILAGTTRKIVLELAEKAGIAGVETAISPEELYSADEAFLTNALIEIMPLTEIEGKAVGSGQPGPVTLQLISSYRRLVNAETEQVISGDTGGNL
jgi:branched-chain amino acid aminotransferase